MKYTINKIFQVFIDFVVGVAIYFGLKALVPSMAENTVAVTTLVATAAFAEFIEVKFKK